MAVFYYFQSIQEAYPPTWFDSLVVQSIHHSNDLKNKYLQSNLNNPIRVIAQFFYHPKYQYSSHLLTQNESYFRQHEQDNLG